MKIKKSAKSKKQAIQSRMKLLIMVVLVAFVFDVGRIFYLQIIKGDELSAKAQNQQLYDMQVPAMRGIIYDSEGSVLAQSATVYDIFIDPYNIDNDDKRAKVVDGLTTILNFDEEQKAELLEKTNKESRYVVVANKVENDLKEQIMKYSAENKLGLIIGATQNTKRYYPHGNLASSILGFTSPDGQGITGLESYYDKDLKGVDGRIVAAKDANRNALPVDYESSVDAIDGNSIKLTLNESIQYCLEKGLRNALNEYQCKGAYGIVMNCNTGAVLAMSSLPDFDCNSPYEITYQKNIDQINAVQDSTEKTALQSAIIQNQWRNFNVSDTYVPGSVFKTFMAATALEENVVNINDKFNCTGGIKVGNYVMKCHKHEGHGVQTFTQGLENSCNPFFITVGQKMGVHTYFKYFEGFGFTQKTGIDLPGEAAPQYYKEEQYGIVELSSASFGQSNSLTPIQVCTGLCAIANGGKLLKPYIVDEIIDSHGNTVSKTQTSEVRRVISEETSSQVRQMMQSVVDHGTGKNGYVAGYRVGGKTGTSTKLGESAEGEKDKYIMSFAAIAPSDNPEVAMLIIVDEPNVDLGGGALCAPIAADVIKETMSVLSIEPHYNETEAKNSIKTPSLIGMSLNDAKTNLSNKNIKFKIIGDGDSVIDQSPSVNTIISNNGSVVLYTKKDNKHTTKVPNFIGLTVSQANKLASDNNINLVISGNNVSNASVVAYSQDIDADTIVEQGSVVEVSFKNVVAVLD